MEDDVPPVKRCSFSQFNSEPCSLYKRNPEETSTIKLSACNKDIFNHLRFLHVPVDSYNRGFKSTTPTLASIETEADLLCRRVGFFRTDKSLTICPLHRFKLGIAFKQKKTCAHPLHQGNGKSYRGASVTQSRSILLETGILVPVGSGLCTRCVKLLSKSVKDHSEDEAGKEDEEIPMLPEDATNCKSTAGTTSYELRPKVKENDNYNPRSSYSNLLENSSQDTGDLSQGSQVSSWSQEGMELPLEDLNKALTTIGNISPLKHRISSDVENLCPSTQRAVKRKATSLVYGILNSYAPGQAEKLIKMCFPEQQSKDSEELKNTNLQQLIIQLYNDSCDRNVKIQLLSMIADLSTKRTLQDLIPSISQYAIDSARNHAAKQGKGVQKVSKDPVIRHRMDREKMDHALDFMFDPTFHQISSFGTKEIKLSSGEQMQIPEVVRTACHSTIINTYLSYCKETDFVPLSRSSLYTILSECPASRRTNLKGLDNIIADGISSLDSLIEISEDLRKRCMEDAYCQGVKEQLLSFKLYLKTDYKHHLQMEDQCPDHCLGYALSDPTNGKFQKTCANHEHDMICSRCNLFPKSITEIKRSLSELKDISEEERKELCVDVESAERRVVEWKSHILRSVNQDNCRKNTLESLKEGSGLVIMDWAMKFLPQLHREKQTDFFGQKGFNWHVIVLVFKEQESPLLKHRTYVHTMDSAKQDWYSVASLLEHALKTAKEQLPSLRTVMLRSDNAGCYHCSNLWHALPGISSRTGVHISAYDFSEAQNGKSYCDSKIAHMRGKMKKYVREGGDIRSAADMKTALDSHDGVSGCQVSYVIINTEKQTTNQSQIKGITKFTDIVIDEGEIMTCWKAFGIGEGQVIPSSQFIQNCTEVTVLEDFKPPKKVEGVIKQTWDAPPNNVTEPGEFLYCPELMCSKKFTSYTELEDHCFIGDHTSISSHDIVKLRWKDVCLDVSTLSTKYRDGSLESGNNSLDKGWGLKKDRKAVRFSDKTRNYLKEIFEKGERDGQKANASHVAKHMRICRDEEGKKVFQPHEYLQPTQIVSYFSRLALQLKCPATVSQNLSTEDLESAIALINKNEAILEVLQL